MTPEEIPGEEQTYGAPAEPARMGAQATFRAPWPVAEAPSSGRDLAKESTGQEVHGNFR